MELGITSWNLQGRERPDLDGVAAVIERRDPDVVVLQEVQRRQADRLAARLGWSVSWAWKHWPLVFPPEGMAILTPEPLVDVTTIPLANRWRFWSSTRRIALAGTHRGVRVVNVHLGHRVHDDEQARQATLALSLASGDAPAIVGGDYNATPGSPVFGLAEAAGFHDTWLDRDGQHQPTFWGRHRQGAPRRCIDYVLVRAGRAVGAPIAGDGIDSDWAALRSLSDHAPVNVTVAFDASPSARG